MTRAKGRTVAAAIAHLAFRNRFVLARWRHRVRLGGPFVPLDDGPLDPVNGVGQPRWPAMPPAEAVRQTVAAEELDRAFDGSAPPLVAEVRGLGSARTPDRFGHRRGHRNWIERALPG